MAEIFKFFNSAPGDPRTYQAADFADYFGSVLSTGLLHTDNVPGMAVSVVAGTLTTRVTAGKAIMKGHLYENTAPLTLTHSLPEATQDRIDRIVLRLDLRNAERNIKLHVKQGVASASPAAPTLQRDNIIYEISLARVLVRKNTVQLLAGDLVDERLNEALCGLVYSLISIPTSQLQAQWDAFMAGIEDSGFASATEFATHKADYLKHTGYAVATGSANAYIATLNPALSAYAEGVSLRLKINVANTGASTVNVNGLGAKIIKKQNGNAVAAGNLKVGLIYTLAYDGSAFILQGEGGSGNLQPNQALAGFTFTNDSGEQVGLGDADLIPANIKKDVSIFDTVGELVPSPDVLAVDSTSIGASFVESTAGMAGRTPTSTTYVRVRAITVNAKGRVRVTFRMYKPSPTGTIYGKIYKNGVPVGIERVLSTTTNTLYTQDFDVALGDVIELYIRTSSSSLDFQNGHLTVSYTYPLAPPPVITYEL